MKSIEEIDDVKQLPQSDRPAIPSLHWSIRLAQFLKNKK
jgi:hypothetical protein